MRFLPRVIIPLVMFMLLIGYQNFSTPTANEWDGQTPLKIIQEMQDFERNDPGVRSDLAVPQSGYDLESVRNNWAERQTKLLLNGFDKRVEDAINEKLNRYVAALIESDPVEAADMESGEPLQNDSVSTPPTSAQADTPAPAKKARNLIKFPRPNVIKYEVSSNSSFNLVANPGDTRLNYSQAYNERTKVGIEHTTANRSTQMFLNYDW